MSPLAEHEYAKCLIADMVAILLEEMDREFIALGSTTLKNDHAEQAVEPDECFYIRHEAEVRGKSRIDLNTDPPPDLALEIDLTSRTHFRHYAALGIPELWRYEGQKLEILVLRQGVYQSAEHSMLFPEFDLKGTVPEVLRQCQLLGRNRALKTFRQGVRSQLARGGSVTP
jgi:Uma2 family endonuclease